MGTARGAACGRCCVHTVTTRSTRSTPPWSRARRAYARCGSAWWPSLVTAVASGASSSWLTGSVALLADTIHNFSDALTAVPLWIAFVLGPTAGDAALHLRLRPCGRSRRHLHRRHDRRCPRSSPATSRSRRLIHPAAGRPPVGVRHRRRDHRLRSATSWWPSTASGSGAGSARLPWSPTACMPAPTASPRWPSARRAAVSRSASRWPTRSSACSSPSRSWSCSAAPPATSTGG